MASQTSSVPRSSLATVSTLDFDILVPAAIELARTFSEQDAVRFVNGVLDAIAKDLYTAVLSDVLDELGYPDQAMPPSIRPLDEALTLLGADNDRYLRLAPAADDTWLLTSLKNAQFKESIDATASGG